MKEIQVNGVTFVFEHNWVEASVDGQRIMSRLKGYNPIVHTDNVGLISLVFNNFIEAENQQTRG